MDRTIYIVDDSEPCLLFVAGLLKKLGYESQSFTDPQEFLLAVRDNPPLACLIDMNFGDTRVGMPLLQASRKYMGEETILLAMSGSTDSKTIAEAVTFGANDFIAKPVDPDILAAKLELCGLPVVSAGGFKFFGVPGGPGKILLSTPVQPLSIQSWGMEFLTAHLFLERAMITMNGAWVEEILGVGQELRVIVVRCQEQRESGKFLVSARFDVPNEAQVISALTRWLEKKGA